MTRRTIATLVALTCVIICPHVGTVHADGDLGKVNHFVFMMQENRSFDNYFGALPYVPGGAYHPCVGRSRTDHRCVDGLTCQPGPGGELSCSNFNLDMAGTFAILIILSAIGVGLHALISLLQRRVVFWMDVSGERVMGA